MAWQILRNELQLLKKTTHKFPHTINYYYYYYYSKFPYRMVGFPLTRLQTKIYQFQSTVTTCAASIFNYTLNNSAHIIILEYNSTLATHPEVTQGPEKQISRIKKTPTLNSTVPIEKTLQFQGQLQRSASKYKIPTMC